MSKYPHISELYKSNWKDSEAQILAENVSESIHQNFDGWTPREVTVIKKYLNDLGLAQINHSNYKVG